MRVSIVIPAYNAAKTLGACLAACKKQTHRDLEIVVVDDGSTDDTAAIAQAVKGVRCIRQENAGPAAARNRGARETQGEIIAFTDSDCVPQRDWVARLAACFEEDVAGVGGTYGIENPQSLLARLVHEEIAARHAAFDREVDFLGSFNVAYRRDAFEAAGGFNEDFRQASGEDNDLAYRLHAAGHRLLFCPEAVVGHVHPERLGAYLRTQARHGFWRMKLYKLHPKRMHGDRYAGFADLIAPPMSLLVLALAPAALLGWMLLGHGVEFGMAYAAVFFLYCRLHTRMTHELLRRTGRGEMVWFRFLAMARDVARALGLLRGGWFFVVRGKERM